jgi:hypothetical protein
MFNLAPTLDSQCLSTAIATEPHWTTGGMAAEVFIPPGTALSLNYTFLECLLVARA